MYVLLQTLGHQAAGETPIGASAGLIIEPLLAPITQSMLLGASVGAAVAVPAGAGTGGSSGGPMTTQVVPSYLILNIRWSPTLGCILLSLTDGSRLWQSVLRSSDIERHIRTEVGIHSAPFNEIADKMVAAFSNRKPPGVNKAKDAIDVDEADDELNMTTPSIFCDLAGNPDRLCQRLTLVYALDEGLYLAGTLPIRRVGVLVPSSSLPSGFASLSMSSTPSARASATVLPPVVIPYYTIARIDKASVDALTDRGFGVRCTEAGEFVIADAGPFNSLSEEFLALSNLWFWSPKYDDVRILLGQKRKTMTTPETSAQLNKLATHPSERQSTNSMAIALQNSEPGSVINVPLPAGSTGRQAKRAALIEDDSDAITSGMFAVPSRSTPVQDSKTKSTTPTSTTTSATSPLGSTSSPASESAKKNRIERQRLTEAAAGVSLVILEILYASTKASTDRPTRGQGLKQGSLSTTQDQDLHAHPVKAEQLEAEEKESSDPLLALYHLFSGVRPHAPSGLSGSLAATPQVSVESKSQGSYSLTQDESLSLDPAATSGAPRTTTQPDVSNPGPVLDLILLAVSDPRYVATLKKQPVESLITLRKILETKYQLVNSLIRKKRPNDAGGLLVERSAALSLAGAKDGAGAAAAARIGDTAIAGGVVLQSLLPQSAKTKKPTTSTLPKMDLLNPTRKRREARGLMLE